RPGTLELLGGDGAAALMHAGLLEDARPCRGTLSRWGTSGFVERTALIDPSGSRWIVDRASLDGGLGRAAEAGSAAYMAKAVARIDRAGGRWRVDVAGVVAVAPRLVLASGRASALPGRLGVTRRLRHRMVALVGWTAARLDDLGDRLIVDAHPDGWWFGI